jgi:hypothetical protein
LTWIGHAGQCRTPRDMKILPSGEPFGAMALYSDVPGCQVPWSLFPIASAEKHAPHDIRVESSAATVHSWQISPLVVRFVSTWHRLLRSHRSLSQIHAITWELPGVGRHENSI